MFDSFAIDVLRTVATLIASDSLGDITHEQKRKDLAWIDALHEEWKKEQIRSDGTIEVEFIVGLIGFTTLGELATDVHEPGVHRKRFPASELRPDQCAGISVKCPADLHRRVWADRLNKLLSAPFQGRLMPIDRATALLLERDAEHMPVDSLAQACHLLWCMKREEARVYSGMLTTLQRKRAEQNRRARESAVLALVKGKNDRDKTVHRMAVDIFLKHPDRDNDFAAAEILKTIGAWSGFSKMTKNSIKRRIGGARHEALTFLARRPK